MGRSLFALVRRHHRPALRGTLIVAAATAAAALVVARTGATAAVKSPPVTGRAPTELRGPVAASGGGPVHGTLALSHEALTVGAARRFSAVVRVGADPVRGEADRAPVSFALAIDRSGSMSGDKIEDAKRAASSLVRSLRPEDEIAVVAYADSPSVLVPRTRVGDTREAVLAIIGSLQAGGGTAIGQALELAQSLVRTADERRVRRVVLVSDGQDTSGASLGEIVSVATQAAGAGVSVSTIGIGTDYTEELMTRLADVSHGNYHYLRDGSALAAILGRELGEMETTVAHGVRAVVTLPAGVRFVSATGADAAPVGGGVELSFGSLFGGDERRAVLELEAAPARAGRMGALSARLDWRDRASGMPARADVSPVSLIATADPRVLEARTNPAELEEWLEVASVARHEQARAAWEAGDLARLRAIETDNFNRIEENNARLQSAELAAQAAEYRQALQQMLANPASTSSGAAVGRSITLSSRGRSRRDRTTGEAP